MHVWDMCHVSFRSKNYICDIYFINFRSKTAYMRYMTLGLDLKIFWDHKLLIDAMKNNLKIIFKI